MSGMEIPAALALAGGVASAGATAYGTMASADALGKSRSATLMAAQEQSAAQEFEAQQLELQGKRIRSAASEDEANRRTDLVSSLQTIDALRAGRNVELDSPTGRAITAGVTSRAEHNIIGARDNYLLQAANSDLSAELSRRKARYSLLAGDASAGAIDDQIAATYAGGIAKIAGIGSSFLKPQYPGR